MQLGTYTDSAPTISNTYIAINNKILSLDEIVNTYKLDARELMQKYNKEPLIDFVGYIIK